jgi:hypothetical protein
MEMHPDAPANRPRRGPILPPAQHPRLIMLRRSPIRPKRLTPRRKGKPAPRIKVGRVEDPEHLALVRALPCIVCGAPPPSETHHPREGQGMGQKADDHQAISLCAACHRTGRHAFHRIGKRSWEALYGPQLEHAERTRAILHLEEP